MAGGSMKSVGKIRQELLLKEIRTAFWEMHHSIPSMAELEKLEEVLV
jgi:hypothetical protein